ncbi:MAG: MBL fold metallo-hydrolase [Candidatus Zixiibacteriota bacterium]
MSVNSFTILGSSSGMPSPDRACSGYVLQIDGRLSLIDCGGGVCSSFLRCGFDPLLVDRIFVSHAHADHVCELPLFIQMVYLAGQQNRLDVFVPTEFVNALASYLNALYLPKEKLPFELEVIGYHAGTVYSQGFELRAIPNRHLDGYAKYIEQLNLPNRMQSHSFDVFVGGKSVFYSADIAGFNDIREHIDGKDYVVIELTHVDLDEFFSTAPSLNVGQFVITHLGNNDQVKLIEQRARKAGMDNLKIAYDGMKLLL